MMRSSYVGRLVEGPGSRLSPHTPQAGRGLSPNRPTGTELSVHSTGGEGSVTRPSSLPPTERPPRPAVGLVRERGAAQCWDVTGVPAGAVVTSVTAVPMYLCDV